MDSEPRPGAEPWHTLKSILTQHGQALVLHPSGACAMPCLGPGLGCVTAQAFAPTLASVGLGTFRVRGRFLPMGGVVLDVRPEPDGARP